MSEKICVWGDSITYGSGDVIGGGWTNRLRSHFLSNEDYDLAVYSLGVSGDNSDDLLERFETEIKARTPEIALIAIGINDSQYIKNKENYRIPIEKTENNLRKLLNISKKYSNNTCSIGLTRVNETKVMPISWDSTKYYDNESIQKYDKIIQGVAKKNDVLYCSVFDLLGDEDLSDGLHPNEIGHEKIFERIKDFLVESKLIKKI